MSPTLQKAKDEHFKIGTLIELTEAVNEQLGTPSDWSRLDIATFAEQFEYLIERFREHNKALADALNECDCQERQP